MKRISPFHLLFKRKDRDRVNEKQGFFIQLLPYISNPEIIKNNQNIFKKIWMLMLFISNFVLDLFNYYCANMKKGVFALIVAALVLISTGLWLFSTPGNLKPFDFLSFGIIIIIVGFALFVGYKRLSSAKRGEPAEDEMSKKILIKTASLSYYISLYLWVGILFVKDRVDLDTEELLGAGILGMAIIYPFCWLVFNIRGVRND